MIGILMVFVMTAHVGGTLHVREVNFQWLQPGKVSLQGDNGLFLARCNNCGPAAYPDSVGIHETNPYNPWSQWTIELIGSKIAFKSDIGTYLSRCNNCWNKSAYPDAVFAHVTSLRGLENPWSLWTPEYLGNDYWAFKADNGLYLTRCNGCVTGGTFTDFAFTHVGSLAGNPWSRWKVQYRFPLGPVTLVADNGGLLIRCTKCGDSGYEDSAGIHESNQGNSWTTWFAEAVGNDKISLKSDHGFYLSRCNNCWNNSTFQNSAFAHVPSLPNNPWSLWQPKRLANGKWTLKGDNGNYLARCNGCVLYGQLDDFAFVHVGTWIGNPWAEWTVKEAFPMGEVNLQGDNGMYLARCNGCGSSVYPDSVGVHETNSENPWSIWTVEPVGSKIALKSDTGAYLTRCKDCWTSSTFPDAVFAHVSAIAGNPWSTWTPQILENGKWALKGDNGNYLARCNGCVSGGSVEDFAFVHVGTWKDNPWAEWTVIKR